ncbi:MULTISPECIES: hypothetical protein [Bacteroides]|nr:MULTISPECIES: hypothetical protein [Bacteroides]
MAGLIVGDGVCFAPHRQAGHGQLVHRNDEGEQPPCPSIEARA